MGEECRDSRKKYGVARICRVCSQIFFLALFLFLFIKTDYTGSDTLEYAVNILFRIDPLLALCTMIGGRVFISLMVPGLLVLLLSLIFGRGFCGWFCPVGTMLDGFHRGAFSRRPVKPTLFPKLGLIILLFIIISSALQFPIAGYLDPFSILVRALAQALYPAFNYLAVSFFTLTYETAPQAVNLVTEPIYSLLKDSVLPFDQKYFDLALLSFLMFAALFVFELIQQRFFCRNLCPLGALLGLFSRASLVRLKGGSDECGTCRQCRTICRMGAIDENRNIGMGSCNLCMVCLEQCPRQVIGFASTISGHRNHETSLSRRQFLTTLAAGLVVPPVLQVRRTNHSGYNSLVRPPGALIEDAFLDRCVRCAECIQVCIGNALQPTLLQAGLEGMFTPRLVARTGYCEFNCTLCGQVCPTGAIRTLTLEEKLTTKIGHAWFDRNRCLPYAKGIPCIVCEEHCPTPDKAIKFRSTEVYNGQGEKVRVKQPFVVDHLCIGCGICETKCPLPGRSAIYVTNDGEDRDPENVLAFQEENPY